jgi:hypothetical protein
VATTPAAFGIARLRDPVSRLEGPALVKMMKLSPLGITIDHVPLDVPVRVIEAAVRSLQAEGIADISVTGFVTWNGRLFGTWGNATAGDNVAPPSIIVDNDRLASVGRSSGLLENLTPVQKPLLYRVFINEVGEIVGVKQVRGPQIPAVESELLRTRVISPGTRGGEPVPVAVLVEVAVP